jgi:nuclear pore complex protein Nup98-Nup96
MSQKDAVFHDSFKPRWGLMDSIVCAKDDMTEPISGVNNRWQERLSVFSEGRDIAVFKYHQTGEVCRFDCLYSSMASLTLS